MLESKLCPQWPTQSLTGVKCSTSSVAEKMDAADFNAFVYGRFWKKILKQNYDLDSLIFADPHYLSA